MKKIGADFNLSHAKGDDFGTTAWFVKDLHEPDDIITYKLFEIFTLKEYFFHLFEEPIDDTTWLRIKHPGTYTIHFDLICSSRFVLIDSSFDNDPSYSFSFELHTKGKIIHFSEHNPKHGIHLEKGENCLLVYKRIPQTIRAGSKIYVYYNI